MAKVGNKVRVDASTFESMDFMGCQPKHVYTQEKGAPRVQDRRDGLPLWNVTLAVRDFAGDGGTITVAVPSATDPGQGFQWQQPVQLVGHVAGSGRMGLWQSADAIEPARARAAASV